MRAQWKLSGLILVAVMMIGDFISGGAFGQSPNVSDVDTLWPSIAPPVTHADVMQWSQRLSLTHEQTIAAERLHATYLADAFELRQRTIDALVALGSEWLLVPRLAPPDPQWKRMLSLRQGYARELAQRDDLLLAQIAEMLTDAQRDAVPPLQLRRNRQRSLADGFVAPWLQSKPPCELRDVVDAADLTPEQRQAVAPIIDEYEAKTTRSLSTLIELLNTMRESWGKFKAPWHDDVHQPPWEEFRPTTVPPGVPVRALLNDEYEALNRLRSILPPETFRTLVVSHARAVGLWGAEYASSLLLIDYALDQQGLTDDQRDALKALRSELEPRYDDLAYEEARTFRRQRWTNPIRLGPGNSGRFIDNEEFRALFQDFQAVGDADRQISIDAFVRISQVLGEDRAEEIRKANWVERSRLRAEEARSLADQPANVAVHSWNLQPWELLDDRPSWALMERVAEAIDASPEQLETWRIVHHELAAAVNTSVGRLEAAVKDATSNWFKPGFAELIQAMSVAAGAAQGEISALDAAFAEAALQTFEEAQPESHAWLAELARQWETINSGPRNLTTSMEYTMSSQQTTISPMLDRLNPVDVLLKSEIDDAHRWAALEALRGSTPAIAEHARELRLATVTAFAQSMLMQAEGQMNSNERTREDWKRYEQIQRNASDTAVAIAAQRRALLIAIGEAVDAAEVALGDDASRAEFHAGVGRIAYPIAWSMVDAAAADFKRAALLADLNDTQHAAIREAAVMHMAGVRDAAENVECLLFAYAQVDAPPFDDRARSALKWAKLEQAILELQEWGAAARRVLRPLLSAEQMRMIEDEAR